jgi:hypothetical protein
MRFTRVLVLLAVAAAWWGGPAAESAGAEGCVRGGRRCSTPPATTGPAKARTERLLAAASRLAPGERIVVPVVYHLVYASFLPLEPGDPDGLGEETPNPDDLEHSPRLALADRQTQALNRAFRGTRFSFRTAGATALDFTPWRDRERQPGFEPEDVELTPMILAMTAGREESLHVFLLRRTQNLAATPQTRGLFDDTPGTDAILMDWDYLPYVGSASPPRARTLRRLYFEGEMLVHLVGHYLGLLHTFEDWSTADDGCRYSCAQTTDLVRDTPAHRWTWDQQIGRCIPMDTCPDAPGMDPMTNYMNLEPDLCASEFTSGQIERMERMVRVFRPYLIVPAAAGAP